MIKSIDTRLLYQASDNMLKSRRFINFVTKGPTIVVIQSAYNHVFGGYARKSWSSPREPQSIKDPNSFLLQRPNVAIFEPIIPRKQIFIVNMKEVHHLVIKMVITEIFVSKQNKTIFGYSKRSRYCTDSEMMTGAKNDDMEPQILQM